RVRERKRRRGKKGRREKENFCRKEKKGKESRLGHVGTSTDKKNKHFSSIDWQHLENLNSRKGLARMRPMYVYFQLAPCEGSGKSRRRLPRELTVVLLLG
ncbi:hypothetical protein, partial [Pseudomonas aeruginosa]|uniref:hypothetical protein n=1 Tax=Pseudomonas aeruginosa TaxID=287 RepID=UPI001C4EE2A4